MKKSTLIALLAIVAALSTSAQKVNDKVEVEHNGEWYSAHILKTNDNGEFYIKYDDWDETWNEWVTKDKIKTFQKAETPKEPLTKFKVGDKVEVEYGMILEPATIIEIGENKYHIKYDNSLFGDKWVTEKKIKKL